MLELAVDLVAEEHRAGLGAELDHAVEHRPGHLEARRVVRGVDVDELRLRADELPQGVEVVRPAVGVGAPPLVHGRTGRARERQRRLVAGRLDHRVVARTEDGVLDGEYPLLGGGERDHGLRRSALVERGDRGTELERARHLGIAEPHRLETVARIRLEREEIRDRHRLAVARREHELGRELVAVVPALDAEGRQLHRAHRLSCGDGRGITMRRRAIGSRFSSRGGPMPFLIAVGAFFAALIGGIVCTSSGSSGSES